MRRARARRRPGARGAGASSRGWVAEHDRDHDQRRHRRMAEVHRHVVAGVGRQRKRRRRQGEDHHEVEPEREAVAEARPAGSAARPATAATAAAPRRPRRPPRAGPGPSRSKCPMNVVNDALVGHAAIIGSIGARMGDAGSRLTPASISRGRNALLGLGDGDDAAPEAGCELDRAGPLGEDRVVAADASAVPGVEAGSPLANDDLAAAHPLSGEDLDPEELRVRVTSVAA